MKNTNFESRGDGEPGGRSFKEDLRDWYDKQYPRYPSYRSPKDKQRLKIIILILLIPLIIIGFVFAGLCLIAGGWILESAYFTFDSDTELDDELLDELYHNLDTDSRLNVTNETYFLFLSIPELNYSIRFDYLFEFTTVNLTNLRIEQHDEVPRITSFESRSFVDPYNLSIEFQINSTDPDILNVTIFPPDNIIYGDLWTYSVDSGVFSIRLDEGEVIGRGMKHEILILPHNQTIIGVAEFDHICPFKEL